MINKNSFQVKINDGPEQTVTINTGLYVLAAAVAIATLEYAESNTGYDTLEVWCPDLIPEYGPYFYMWDGNQITPTLKR